MRSGGEGISRRERGREKEIWDRKGREIWLSLIGKSNGRNVLMREKSIGGELNKGSNRKRVRGVIRFRRGLEMNQRL